jgi:tetratricopeptide (TPR) repeat protein
LKTLQIFVSSPGDVHEERALASRVIDRLQSEYIGRLVLEPVLWEREPLVATSTFQQQIVKPSDTDIVIAILWSRLGTKLPKEFTRPDGTRYDSGTEYEFEEAIDGFRKNGRPDLLVYRKTTPPSVRLDDEKELMARLEQKKRLDEFVDKWFHDKAEGTLKAAFHAFDSASDFESLLENHLYKLIERQLPASVSATSEARAVWKKGSPFRGLNSFHFEHAPIFFGRTRAVSDILQSLRDQDEEDRNFVVILGMSGGGKSSVARAGVLPMLTRPGVIEGVGLWRRTAYKPTDVRGDLFTGLAGALLRECALPGLDPDNKGPAELAQVLEESPRAAVALIKSALNQAAADEEVSGDSRLALIVDQMEEMFTQDDVLPKQRKAFVDVLDALARSGRVWVICTLRSDFYPRLATLPKLGELKEGSGQYDLMPPTANEIGQMIRLPTRGAGLRFEEDPTTSERLDDMLRDAAAARPEVLPLLQFTLEELYQRRTEDGMLTISAYRELGGVEGSLAQRAETVFEALPDDVQAELPRVLNALVSIEQNGHETIGRKRAHMTEEMPERIRTLVETFVENRLFVTELTDNGAVVVSVAHEALLWHWPRVREWVDQNRENLRIRGRIVAAAGRWLNEKKPADLLLPRGKPLGEAKSLIEQHIELDEIEMAFIDASIAKAKRIQQIKAGVITGIAALAVVAAGLAFVASQQRDEALAQRTRAEVEAETARRTTEFMVDLFEVSDPSEALGNTITAREILDKGIDRVDTELADQPAIQATLKSTMGTVYTSLGLYGQAIPLLQSSLDTRREVLGADDPQVFDSMDDLGRVFGRSGDYAKALEFYREAYDAKVANGEAESLEAAISLSGMAEMLMEQGEYANADPLFVEALEVRRKLLGDSHPDVAESSRKYGLNLFYEGQFEEAEKNLREAVVMLRELHGEVHPDLDVALNDLGWALLELNNLDEAEALFSEALQMKKTLLGEIHPRVAMGLSNVAWTYYYRGDLDQAEQLTRQAIRVQRASVGESHPDLALFLNTLAALLYENGETEAAMTVANDALILRRRLLHINHPLIADGAAMLAYWSMQTGDFDEAEKLLDECLAIRRENLGDSHPDVASALTLKAGVQLEQRRFNAARETAQVAREVLEASFPADHWRIAAAANAEGAALTGLGEFAQAEQMLLSSNPILSDAPMPGVSEASRERLAVLYTAWGKNDEARKYRAAD